MRPMLALAVLATLALACPAAAQDGLNLSTGVMAPPVCPDPYGCYVAPDGRTAQQLVDAHVLPDPAHPGVFNPAVYQSSIGQTICVHGWTATVRPPTSVTNRLKAALLPAGRKLLDYELDHRVSIEDGGARADPANLWMMVYADPYGARVKDVLETRLSRLACSGKITLDEARRALMGNWLVAYQRYVGPLPGEHVHAAGWPSPSEPDAIPAESSQPAR